MNSSTYDGVPLAMPQEALVVAIPVLILSIISLAVIIMLFLMHFYHSERWSYISLMALSVIVSTIASIAQQFWYMTNWRYDRISEYKQALLGVDNPIPAIGPLSLGPSLVLFWIQLYCYNVLSALCLCWAVALVRGVHNMRPVASTSPNKFAAPATKIASIVLPIIMVTIPFAPALQQHGVLCLIITCAPMLCCWVVGSACIVLILVKYIRHIISFRKLESSTGETTGVSLATSLGKKSLITPQTDKWLLLRFTFTFVALSAFEVLIIKTAFARHSACVRLAAMPGPDFSRSSTINSVITFIPGVLIGFIGFLVFGTTSFFRKIYIDTLKHYCSCCCAGAKWQKQWRKHKHQNSSSSSKASFALGKDKDLEDGRSWQAMGNGRGRMPTYHCRVESTALGAVELTKFPEKAGAVGKKGPVVRTMESPVKAKQPWKTLGVDPPEGREH